MEDQEDPTIREDPIRAYRILQITDHRSVVVALLQPDRPPAAAAKTLAEHGLLQPDRPPAAAAKTLAVHSLPQLDQTGLSTSQQPASDRDGLRRVTLSAVTARE